jgi:hypothetical protein
MAPDRPLSLFLGCVMPLSVLKHCHAQIDSTVGDRDPSCFSPMAAASSAN